MHLEAWWIMTSRKMYILYRMQTNMTCSHIVKKKYYINFMNFGKVKTNHIFFIL